MKNVTITLDKETATWARVHAAQRGMSLSRMVGELLRQRMREAQEYDDAMRCYLAKVPVKLKRSAMGYALRSELHERTRLR
jgi:hypothetical protein